LLARVYFVPLAFVKKERFDIPAEKVAGFGCPHVESVVIDELHLLLKPFIPANLANPRVNSLA
jgi:hypothetical protein